MAFDNVLVDKVVAGILASAQALRNAEGGWQSAAAAWWRGGSSEEANEEAHRIEGWLAACGGSELNAVLLRLATYTTGDPNNGASTASLSVPEGSAEDIEYDVASDELTRTIKAVKNRAPRHSRARLLDFLCRNRHQELDTTSKALLLRCLQRLKMSACVPRAEALARRLLCSSKGCDLVRLKLKVSSPFEKAKCCVYPKV